MRRIWYIPAEEFNRTYSTTVLSIFLFFFSAKLRDGKSTSQYIEDNLRDGGGVRIVLLRAEGGWLRVHPTPCLQVRPAGESRRDDLLPVGART